MSFRLRLHRKMVSSHRARGAHLRASPRHEGNFEEPKPLPTYIYPLNPEDKSGLYKGLIPGLFFGPNVSREQPLLLSLGNFLLPSFQLPRSSQIRPLSSNHINCQDNGIILSTSSRLRPLPSERYARDPLTHALPTFWRRLVQETFQQRPQLSGPQNHCQVNPRQFRFLQDATGTGPQQLDPSICSDSLRRR